MSEVKVDTISERTTDGGVTIDGVLVKDGVATFQTAAGSPLVFEGATADAYETTFAITDPTADRTITFPDSSFTVPTSGGLTAASLWKLTVTHTDSANPIDANLSESTTVGQGVLGDAMTESSGVFQFPSTGFWHVTATFTFHRTSGDSGAGGFIKSTVNDGTDWTIIAGAYVNLLSAGVYSTTSIDAVLDVTDIDNNKVSFQTSHDNASNSTVGSSTRNLTCFTFTKLADT